MQSNWNESTRERTPRRSRYVSKVLDKTKSSRATSSPWVPSGSYVATIRCYPRSTKASLTKQKHRRRTSERYLEASERNEGKKRLRASRRSSSPSSSRRDGHGDRRRGARTSRHSCSRSSTLANSGTLHSRHVHTRSQRDTHCRGAPRSPLAACACGLDRPLPSHSGPRARASLGHAALPSLKVPWGYEGPMSRPLRVETRYR